MASVCDVCGKKPQFGMRLSHSHRRTKRRWNPNIQRVRAVVNGTPEAGQRLHLLPEGRQGPEAGSEARPDGVSGLTCKRPDMQGVVKMYDPLTREGIVVVDTDRSEVVLAADALDGSIFRMLRQGQRVVFELDADGRATNVRTGAEPDLGPPDTIALASLERAVTPRGAPPRRVRLDPERRPRVNSATIDQQHARADERDEHRPQAEVADALVAGQAEQPARRPSHRACRRRSCMRHPMR